MVRLSMLQYGLGMPIRGAMECLRQKRSPLEARRFASTSIALTMIALMLWAPGSVCAQDQDKDKPASSSAGAQVAKAVGTIKSIQVDSITVAAESGGEVTAKLMSSTKILRVPPGEKDLKNAIALEKQDLQPGDRVLVRGQASSDGHTIAALAVIVMKQADVAAKQQHDLDDWQKRGVDGLVTKVDAGTSIITISAGGMAASRSIAVHIAKDTILRRYAPGSVNFDDAKPAPIDQIKVGDQFRARGMRSPDGSEITAEEAVSGTFRNIAGTVKAIDAASNTMTVQDAISKGTVVVRVSADSQMWKLPPEMARGIAMRLKGAPGGGSAGQAGSVGQGQGQAMSSGQGSLPGAGGAKPASESPAGRRPGGGSGANGPPDLQRMLSRAPTIKLADLQKGDAVVILATAGGNSDTLTASKLVAGVEAILTAAPAGSASSLLSPWSLGTGGEGETAQ
jgi:Domain of unknown function (DUF5666)